MLRRPPRPPELDDDDDDNDYAALKSAAAWSAGIASLFDLAGGGVVIVGLFGGYVAFMGKVAPLPLIVAAVLAVVSIGVSLFFTAWRLKISGQSIWLQINLAEDARRAAAAAEAIRDDAGKLELQLRTIAASAARTAEAVETLAGRVRRPPAA